MNTQAEKRITKAILEFLIERGDLDVATMELAGMASFDLNFGPFSAQDFAEECPERKAQWPGWESAARMLQDVIDDLPTLYVEYDAECVSAEEPQPTGYKFDENDEVVYDYEPGYDKLDGEEHWDYVDYYKFTPRDIAEMVFGAELVNNIR